MKKTYQWILFDADETLSHFDAFTGLQIVFSRYGIEFTKQHYEEYQQVNKPLWVEYQNAVEKTMLKRSMNYSTQPSSADAASGEWSFVLQQRSKKLFLLLLHT